MAGVLGNRTVPATDEVHVSVVPLDAPPVPYDVLFADLTADERARALRYKVGSARQQFVIGRGMLRRLLGACLGQDPMDVAFTFNENGKPLLAEAGTDLHFNVTHTDGLALIAIGQRQVGVDVERVRTIANPEGLVCRFFSQAEREMFLAMENENRPAGFFRGWTSKEAVIKAAGLSVACLNDFDVELHPARPAALLAARHAALVATSWQLAAWEAAPGYTAALAVPGTERLALDL